MLIWITHLLIHSSAFVLIITVIALRKKGMEILQKKSLSNLPILTLRVIDVSFKRFNVKKEQNEASFECNTKVCFALDS